MTLLEAKYSKKQRMLEGDKDKILKFAKILKARKTLNMERYDLDVESAKAPWILIAALLERTRTRGLLSEIR